MEYNFGDIEKKWQQRWIADGTYKVANDPNWQIVGYLGAGVFEKTSAHEEEDLRRFLSGDDL